MEPNVEKHEHKTEGSIGDISLNNFLENNVVKQAAKYVDLDHLITFIATLRVAA